MYLHDKYWSYAQPMFDGLILSAVCWIGPTVPCITYVSLRSKRVKNCFDWVFLKVGHFVELILCFGD